MKYLSSMVLISVLLFPLALCAEGSFDNVITARQAAFTQIDESSEAVEDKLDSSDINWQTLNQHSAELVAASSSLKVLFPKGSHENSKAKEKIWDDAAQFNAELAKMNVQFLALNNAIKQKNSNAAEEALNQATSACNGCHRKYRSLW
jgi:cytochrome c556